MLTARYADFTAWLTFTPMGPRTIALRVDTRPKRRRLRRLVLNIVLPFRSGAKLRMQDGSAFTLGSAAPVSLARPVTGWIDDGRIRFSASRPCAATWPFIPFSSYRSPLHQRDGDDAWFVVSITLDAQRADRVDLTWRVKA